jgi:SAM-dependent methyltransferase
MTESVRPWYVELFTNYARAYDKECFTQGTAQEIGFLTGLIDADRKIDLLDVGCGTGRHAIEFSRLGHRVTGIDLSANQLGRAREKAAAAGVTVKFEERDARRAHYDSAFDMAIMLCEGGFSLMETDAMNVAILENAVRALRPGGRFVFTALNALFPLARSVKDFTNTAESGVKMTDEKFDLATLRILSNMTFLDDDGRQHEMATNERHYMPSELAWYMTSLGMEEIEVHGCVAGDFKRQPPTPEEFELMVIARKPGA